MGKQRGERAKATGLRVATPRQMQARLLRRQHGASPALALTAVFVAWKLVLLAVALGAGVGPSYDTSTELILQAEVVGPDAGLPRSGWWEELVTRLTRWDAIYFVNVAHRGYRFEQEWAFGSGLPVVIAAVVKGLSCLVSFSCPPLLCFSGHTGSSPVSPHPVVSPRWGLCQVSTLTSRAQDCKSCTSLAARRRWPR